MTSKIKTLVLLTALTGIMMAVGMALGGRGGLVIAFGVALVMNIGSFWFSDKIVLKMYKARPVDPVDSPALHRMVEELSANAGIPKPRIYVVPEEAPNAFATGRNPDNAVVAVTEGILKALNPNELRGVLAHEIAHIAHRDILIQGVAAVLASGIVFAAGMLRWTAIFGGGRSNSDGSGNNNIFAAIAMAILAPLAASLIQMAISRSREYLADEGGAQFSGHPEDLASALAKLQSYSGKVPMHGGSEATAHMFIVNPFAGGIASLFSTHPPMQERIDRLMAMRR